MAHSFGALFEPLDVKGHTFRNRIVMPPMVANRGIVSQDGVKWYGEHAAGGVALVIVEATPVTRFGNDLNVEDLRALVDAIHEGGALAAIQLFPVAWGRQVAPAELGPDEISDMVDGYEVAARVCSEAGFDGVEPHGAHGFVLNQFFSPADNARADEFGGCMENRMRAGIEVVRAARRGLGSDRLLLYRHTPAKENSYSLEESLVFAGRLVGEGLPQPADDGLSAHRRPHPVKVPAGIDTGTLVRVAGEGIPGEGGGPAGVAAGVYAARKRILALLLVKEWGGQSVVSPDIQNWIGTVSVSGSGLAKMLENHVRAYADDVLDIKEGAAISISKSKKGTFILNTENGTKYEGKAVLVCSGSRRKKLEIPGAKEFDNKGISYCSSCDAPIFKDKDVVVIGGGNAGFEAALQLLSYASSVTLLEQRDKFTADPVTVDKVLENPKMKAITGVQVVEIKGNALVSSIVYEKGGRHELEIGGVFVEIGAIPNSDFVKDLTELNKYGEIIVDHKTQRSSLLGIWAAGDVTDVLYKQNNISCGDAVKALEDIYIWLQKN